MEKRAKSIERISDVSCSSALFDGEPSDIRLAAIRPACLPLTHGTARCAPRPARHSAAVGSTSPGRGRIFPAGDGRLGSHSGGGQEGSPVLPTGRRIARSICLSGGLAPLTLTAKAERNGPGPFASRGRGRRIIIGRCPVSAGQKTRPDSAGPPRRSTSRPHAGRDRRVVLRLP